MPFSSSICLTNIGVLPTGSNLNIYSNTDAYSTPFQTNTPLSQLDSNCPFILTNIPDGTTTIKFVDSTSNCCYELLLSPNNLCDLFGIQLTGFSSTTISQIIAGNLISSVGNITDYIIDWYGPDNNTTVAFTSGYGTVFGPYQQTHPFVRVSLPGYYVPMIQKIRINGINYSITGGTGFIQANIDCLENQTVEVFPSTCSGNRVEPITTYVNYNNYFVSNTAAYNTPPESLSIGFDLDINSKYFAWQFRTDVVSDTIKIMFHGGNYPTPIVLEYYTVGYEYTELNVYNTPKTIKVNPSLFFKKITDISNFLRTENDYLTIEVTPNPTITRTNWDLYFKCLGSFDCSTCLDILSPYKIVKSSIGFQLLDCYQYKFSSSVSACTCTDIENSDVFKYLTNNSGIYGTINSTFDSPYCSNTGLINFQTINNTGSTSCLVSTLFYAPDTGCSNINGGITTFSKTNDGPGGSGRIYMTFAMLEDLTIYYNSYLNIVNAGLGTPFDNTNINYYRFFTLTVPIIPITDQYRTCASDSSNVTNYGIHTSSVVTTGQTGNVYYMNITMPTITDGIDFNSCELGCNMYVSAYVQIINQHSMSEFNQFNFTSLIGAKKIYPFVAYQGLYKTTSGPSYSQNQGKIVLTNLVTNTVPMLENTYTPIPSLSSSTCNFSTYHQDFIYGLNRYTKLTFWYSTEIINGNIFQIKSQNYNGSILIYQYNLKTNTQQFIDPTYFI